MENPTKKYWKGLEELRNDETFVKNAHNEFGSFEAENSNKTKSWTVLERIVATF
ncbi:MAG: TAT-variant-translocated molybdopterin oxidoreductase [Spirosomataceae bacterium]